jgi:hypothetical protein
MSRTLGVLGALCVLLHLGACTQEKTTLVSSGPGEFPDRAATALSDVAGLWLLENGGMMSDFIGGLASPNAFSRSVLSGASGKASVRVISIPPPASKYCVTPS